MFYLRRGGIFLLRRQLRINKALSAIFTSYSYTIAKGRTILLTPKNTGDKDLKSNKSHALRLRLLTTSLTPLTDPVLAA